MKYLFFALVLVATQQANANTTLICEPGVSSRPFDTFFIEFTSVATADVTYQRQPAYGSGEFSPVLIVRGCKNSKAARNQLGYYVECAGHGAAGTIELKEVGVERLAGFVYFPVANLGYPDHTRLEVTCHVRF